jgi:hypothetical protein
MRNKTEQNSTRLTGKFEGLVINTLFINRPHTRGVEQLETGFGREQADQPQCDGGTWTDVHAAGTGALERSGGDMPS